MSVPLTSTWQYLTIPRLFHEEQETPVAMVTLFFRENAYTSTIGYKSGQLIRTAQHSTYMFLNKCPWANVFTHTHTHTQINTHRHIQCTATHITHTHTHFLYRWTSASAWSIALRRGKIITSFLRSSAQFVLEVSHLLTQEGTEPVLHLQTNTIIRDEE